MSSKIVLKKGRGDTCGRQGVEFLRERGDGAASVDPPRSSKSAAGSKT